MWGQSVLAPLADLLESPEGQHSLVVLDVDNLTQINEHLGHEAGDRILADVEVELATYLTDAISERWLGDQYLVLFPHTDTARAATLMRAFMDQLNRSSHALRYSLSGGGSTSPTDGTSNRELVASCATALALAKAPGRGQVVWAGLDSANVSEHGRAATRSSS